MFTIAVLEKEVISFILVTICFTIYGFLIYTRTSSSEVQSSLAMILPNAMWSSLNASVC